MNRTPTGWRVVDHGMDHPQYFQGHGVAFTKFEDCATGIGSTKLEAFEDAIDSLAQNGWDVESINASDLAETDLHVHELCELANTSDEQECEMMWFVSVDVK